MTSGALCICEGVITVLFYGCNGSVFLNLPKYRTSIHKFTPVYHGGRPETLERQLLIASMPIIWHYKILTTSGGTAFYSARLSACLMPIIWHYKILTTSGGTAKN